MTAFIDESGGSGRDPENVYILVATIALCESPDDYRRILRELKPPSAKKLHWYEADADLRRATVDVLTGLEALHVVVESVEHPETKKERHRRLCMKTLLRRLDVMGVGSVVMESRGTGDNARDRKMIKTLKVDQSISTDFEVVHRDGPFEPLLWVPDAVCGAVVDKRMGNPEHLARLSPMIEWA